MDIRLPRLPRWAIRAVDWLNEPAAWRARRIDVVLVLFGALVAAYYWYVYGWLGALTGTAMYGFVVLTVLMF